MTKILPVAFLMALVALAFSSCDSSLTYANQLADEKDAIQQFIEDSSFVIVHEVPTSLPWTVTTTDANGNTKVHDVFYLTESGLYVHVVDTGAFVNKNIHKNTEICVRYWETGMDGVSGYNNMKGTADAVLLRYDNVCTTDNTEDCLAWHEGLDYVGDGGRIRMIVPASLGWSMYTTSAALTAQYYELSYTFWK